MKVYILVDSEDVKDCFCNPLIFSTKAKAIDRLLEACRYMCRREHYETEEQHIAAFIEQTKEFEILEREVL